MTDTQLFEYLYFSPKTIKNKLVNHFEILANNNILSEFYPKQYKLQKGVFNMSLSVRENNEQFFE